MSRFSDLDIARNSCEPDCPHRAVRDWCYECGDPEASPAHDVRWCGGEYHRFVSFLALEAAYDYAQAEREMAADPAFTFTTEAF
jgi:hypothetical protein